MGVAGDDGGDARVGIEQREQGDAAGRVLARLVGGDDDAPLCRPCELRAKEVDLRDIGVAARARVAAGQVEDDDPEIGADIKGVVQPRAAAPVLARGAQAGDQVLANIFAAGERVDVIGTSRGKGFQGVVKRHHFGGGAATHGSMFHRAPGSIGASSFPSRVVKGMRAAGRMGGGRTTIHNLKVLRVDPIGAPASGNPIPGSPVFTTGHHTVNGLCESPTLGVYETEAPREVNVLDGGANYGWPTPSRTARKPASVLPAARSGAAGCAVEGNAIFVATTDGQALLGTLLGANGKVGALGVIPLDKPYGRLRTVVAAPDGALWLTTTNKDGHGHPSPDDERVIRIVQIRVPSDTPPV